MKIVKLILILLLFTVITQAQTLKFRGETVTRASYDKEKNEWGGWSEIEEAKCIIHVNLDNKKVIYFDREKEITYDILEAAKEGGWNNANDNEYEMKPILLKCVSEHGGTWDIKIEISKGNRLICFIKERRSIILYSVISMD